MTSAKLYGTKLTFQDIQRSEYEPTAGPATDALMEFPGLEDSAKKERRGKCCAYLRWLTQVEGNGEYRCVLGNKTSDEWCYKKERCYDYVS